MLHVLLTCYREGPRQGPLWQIPEGHLQSRPRQDGRNLGELYNHSVCACACVCELGNYKFREHVKSEEDLKVRSHNAISMRIRNIVPL